MAVLERCLKFMGATLRLTGLLFILMELQLCTSDTMIAPRFDQHPQSEFIKHHGKAVLHCHVTPDTAQIRWKFNGLFLSDTNPGLSGIEINGGRLQILSFRHLKKDTDMSHEGVYQCVANNTVGVISSREAKLERAFMGQFEEGSTQEIKATEGNTAVIPCTPPKGVPPPVTIFKFNGQKIENSSKRHLVLPSGNMQISGVKQSDEGEYMCISINTVSGQERISPYQVRLKVKTPTTNSAPEFVQSPIKKQEVIQGEDLTLECVFQGSPVPLVVWDKHNGQLPEGTSTQVLGNLVIRDVQLEDQGTYICRAENTIGPVQADIAEVTVIAPPRIEIAPADRIGIDGATVAFQCVASGRNVHTEWLYNGNILSSSAHISITGILNATSLTISRASKRNEGIYQCVARSQLGMTTAAALLQVKGPDEVNFTWPELPVFPEFDEEDENNNGRGVDESYEIIIDPTATATMSLPPFGQPDDSSNGGNTRRRNKNNRNNRNRNRGGGGGGAGNEDYNYGGGFDDSEMVPPSAPEVKKNTDTSVVVRWEVPQNDGLSINFFKIQYKEVSAKNRNDRQWQTYTADIDPNVHLQEVRRLEPGATYKFRVLAVYSNNDNRPGATSKRFTLEVEDSNRTNTPRNEPIIVKADPSSPNTLAIQWQYYDEDTNQISGFYIYYREDRSNTNFNKVTIPGANMRRHTIRDLDPDTYYKVKMVSYNTAGEGPYSNEVVKETLPLKGSQSGGKTRDPFDDMFPYNQFTGKYIHSTTKRPLAYYPDDRQSTAKSNQMLYIVLGVVLGLVLLGLLVFMLLCWRKQRKERRAMNCNKNDSLRKKPQTNGGPNFLLRDLHSSSNGGLADKIGNGHVSTGYGGHHPPPNGINQMGMTVNPFQHMHDQQQMQTTQFEGSDRNYSPEDMEIQNLRQNLQEMLNQPPPPIPPERGAPQVYTHPHNYYEVDPNHPGGGGVPHGVHMNTFGGGCPDCSQHSSRPQSRADAFPTSAAPPDYNSLNMRNHAIYSNNHSINPNRMSGDFRDYTGSLHRNKPMTNPYHMSGSAKEHYRNSPDHIPRSHERPPFKPYNSNNRSLRTTLPVMPPHHQYEQYSNSNSPGTIMMVPGSHDSSRGSGGIDPSEMYERVPGVDGNHMMGSQGRPRKHSHGARPAPPHRSFSMDNRPSENHLSDNPLIIPPLPGGMMGMQMPMKRVGTPPRLPPRNPPQFYSNTPPPQHPDIADLTAESTSPHHFTPVQSRPSRNNDYTDEDIDNEANSSTYSSSGINNSLGNNKKESPKVFDNLSQDLPVINGSLGGGTTEETDTLPSSVSNQAEPDLTMSENMDSDLEAMHLSDHDEDQDEMEDEEEEEEEEEFNVNRSLHRVMEQEVSDDELEPLVDRRNHQLLQQQLQGRNEGEDLEDVDIDGGIVKNADNNNVHNGEITPLMQRNIPRAIDYPSDDDNEGS